MEITKRSVTKLVAHTIVATMAASAITKTLVTNVPVTQKLKIAEITGYVGGGIIAEKLAPQTSSAVDNFYTKLEARKNHKLVK